MNTLDKEWKIFAEAILLGVEPTSVQYREMERAFKSGMVAGCFFEPEQLTKEYEIFLSTLHNAPENN